MKVHIPVLVHEVCSFLPAGRDALIVVDGTFGYGGHYQAIEKFLGDRLKVYYGIDQDEKALCAFQKETALPDSLKLIHGTFQSMDTLIPPDVPVDVVLLDLGVSTPLLTEGGRGLSVYHDEPLDMRISPSFHPDNAVELLQKIKVKDLQQAIEVLTPLKSAHKIARALKDFSQDPNTPKTTGSLIQKLRPYLSSSTKNRTHPATTIFMMLRILVNEEVEALEDGLPKAIRMLCSGGRLMVISFHGLEHRLVKQQLLAHRGYGKILNKKPICPTHEEIRRNPSARSAQLRVFEKL